MINFKCKSFQYVMLDILYLTLYKCNETIKFQVKHKDLKKKIYISKNIHVLA